MATHTQCYLTCNECGKQYIGTDGERFGETEDEIRGIAEDEGWLCGIPVSNGSDRDLCGECRPAVEDLWQKLGKTLDESGLKLKVGLRQQGKIPTVEHMLSEGKTWDEIATAIGWSDGAVVKQWYGGKPQGKKEPK